VHGGKGYGNTSREPLNISSDVIANAVATIREIIPFVRDKPRELGSVVYDLTMLSAQGDGVVEFTLAVAKELLDAGADPYYGVGPSVTSPDRMAAEFGNEALAELIRRRATRS